MKKNVFISNVLTETGVALAKAYRESGYYVYGVDKKEDYAGICDRALRFDLFQFVIDAEYRVRFTQIFDEIMPKLDVLVFCQSGHQTARLNEIQLDYWNAALNADVTGPMLLSKLFQSRLESAVGSILFLFPTMGIDTPGVDLAYMTSISAGKGLMKAMSMDLKGKITVNAIQTSPFFLEKEPIEDDYLEDVAKMAVFLTTENMGSVNGAEIVVDGNKRRG